MLLSEPALAGDPNWPRFRGPNGQGLAEGSRLPDDFGQESEPLWKTPVPVGYSSPVIWGDRIFFTAIDSVNEEELVTLCINRQNGQVLWRRSVQAQEKAELHPRNHPASPTPAVDSEHVYVYFGTYGLICYDHEGEPIWDCKIQTPKSAYGVSTSPILHGEKVILVLDNGNQKESRLLAVSRDTGDTVWEQPRPLFYAGWSTPMIWRHDGVEELVVFGFRRLTSYNLSTGEEIWWAGGFPGESIGIPAAGSGLLFAGATQNWGRGDEQFDLARIWKITCEELDKNQDGKIQSEEITEDFDIPMRPDLPRDDPGYGLGIGGKEAVLKYFDRDKDGAITEAEVGTLLSSFASYGKPTLLAVRPGAQGDARQSHVAWEVHQNIPEVPSLLCYQGRLYLMRDGGLLTCLNALTGEELFRERIGAPGQYMASPIAADGKVLVASVPGVVTIIQAGDELKMLARRDFDEKIFATAAAVDDRLYIRTEKRLYAFGQ